jgi:hypothetical protein
MKSDLQGMAVAVEHVAEALGATAMQLYEKFKQLWEDPDVTALLKRSDVPPLARQVRLAEDWPTLKAKIEALRALTLLFPFDEDLFESELSSGAAKIGLFVKAA